MALLDSNIGLILHAVGEYDLSLRFLEKALALNKKYYGSRSLKGNHKIHSTLIFNRVSNLKTNFILSVAVSYHLVARTQSCMGDFRSALQNEKETYTIYKIQVSISGFINICSINYIIGHFCLTKCLFFFSWERNTRKQKSHQNAFDT